MCISPGKYTFYISSLLKQTSAKGGQNRHLFPALFRSLTLDKGLCVVELLEAYIKRTAPLRQGTKQLLLCYTAPHGPVSKDTISRWIKHCKKKRIYLSLSVEQICCKFGVLMLLRICSQCNFRLKV